MALLEENKIAKFFKKEYGSVYGSDSGYGFEYGDGSGSGSGYGSVYGDGYSYGSVYGFEYGDGSGSGSGYGFEYGDGYSYGSVYGYGSGYGSGYGDGNGDGNGSGKNPKKFCGNKIYVIDEIPTIIKHISKNIAKGFILRDDFTLKSCYIAKGHNLFAHGETIEKAIQALQEKIFSRLDTEETIEEFKKKFNNNDKYEGTEFFKWHNYLTGSCEMGRNNFVKSHQLDLKQKYTVKEFIELCKNDYGGGIIKRLEEFYK